LGPIYGLRGFFPRGYEPGDCLPSPGDDNFFPRANPAQKAFVAIPQIPNGRRFHCATNLAHNGPLSSCQAQNLPSSHHHHQKNKKKNKKE
jgi:hypothetical protein